MSVTFSPRRRPHDISARPSRVGLLWLTPANVECDDRETPNDRGGCTSTSPAAVDFLEVEVLRTSYLSESVTGGRNVLNGLRDVTRRPKHDL